MDCNKLTDGIYDSCDDRPIKGLKSEAVIINYSDIETYTQSGSTITSLTLASGLAGHKVQWYRNLANVGGTFVPSTDSEQGFTHSFASRISTSSAENSDRAFELSNSTVVMVVRTKYVGTDNLEEIKIYGIKSGMVLSEMVHNTDEASGANIYTLSTEEGALETHPYYIFNEGTYSTSKASFDALFANV